MLEIVIGIIFTYLLLSLLATTINELLASWRGWRGFYLDEGLQKLLEKGEASKIYEKFVNNPLYRQMMKHKAPLRVSRAPSYLKNSTFTAILLTILKKDHRDSLTLNDFIQALPEGNKLRSTLSELKEEGKEVVESLKEFLTKVEGKEDALDKLDDFIATLPEGSKARSVLEKLKGKGEDAFDKLDVATNLLTAQNVGQLLGALPTESKLGQILTQLKEKGTGKIEDFKKEVDGWFDEVMDRAGGWYKRHVQMVTVIIGLGIAAFLNADTFNMYRHLASNTDDRKEIVSLATDFVEKNEELPTPRLSDADAEQIKLDIQNMLKEDIGKVKNPLGLGWGAIADTIAEDDGIDWLYRILGWLVTALAISLGAPFWFDILNRIVRIRGAGNQSEGTTVVVNTESPPPTES